MSPIYMRQKLIVANWKMNSTIEEALKFFAALQHTLKGTTQPEIVVCPPFTALYALDEAFAGTTLRLGAQNMHWEESGAFTGEISPLFLKELGVAFVILGHSERRKYFGETDAIINKKVSAALHCQLTPIICVGETEEEKNSGKTMEVVGTQVKKILDGQMKSDLESVVWAYEPVWAIGTGKNATAKDAEEVIRGIRALLAKGIDAPTANGMRILYGGSVSETNAGSFLNQENIDGLLIGGASLDPKKLVAIVHSAESPHTAQQGEHS